MGNVMAQKAIEQAYHDHATQLWRGVYAVSGGRRDIADDAVAEAFARAIEHAEQIRAPLPWLYRVALREAAARLRKEQAGSDSQAAFTSMLTSPFRTRRLPFFGRFHRNSAPSSSSSTTPISRLPISPAPPDPVS